MRAELGRISKDFDTKKYIIELVTSESDLAFLDELRDVECDVTIKKWHPRRSLSANAYCWVLCQKLAEKLGTSKDDVYEELLQKYGYFLIDNDKPVVLTVSSRVDMSTIDGHYRFYATSSDGRFKSYIIIRGTSQYDSKEMAHFIDNLIVECKEQGIETLPPDELARMMEEWGNQNDKKAKGKD